MGRDSENREAAMLQADGREGVPAGSVRGDPAEVVDQAAADMACRRRRTMAMLRDPMTISDNVPGSGTDETSTPSRSANGGRPSGPPKVVKLSVVVVELAVKTKLCNI